MSVKQPSDMGSYLKGKRNILLLAGSLCDEIDFDGKKLLDYTAEIAGGMKAPVAATGNTPLSFKAKGVNPMKKMWAAEVMNFMRHPWEESIIEQKPEVLVFIGYPPRVAQRLVSTVKDAETIVLGNTYVEEATYSLPDSSSLRQWQQSLEQLTEALSVT